MSNIAEATMSFMTGPTEGEITIRMACPHGTDEMAFRSSVDNIDEIRGQAETLAARHWDSFGCNCEIGVFVNGEDTVQ